MPTILKRMKLRTLLEEKAGIRSSRELRDAIGGSAAQASNLWHGHDTIGATLMLRILKAFPAISIEDLAQVEEAAKALKPPPIPKPRSSPTGEKSECAEGDDAVPGVPRQRRPKEA